MPRQRPVGFSRRDATVLAEVADDRMAGRLQPQPLTSVPPEAGPFVQMGKTDGNGVSAMSGTTLGTGNVEVWRTLNGTFQATGITYAVVNNMASAVAADTNVTINLTPDGWVVIAEDCGA